MNHKYRKLPVVITAMQLPPEHIDASEELLDFLHSMKEDWIGDQGGIIVIHTLEGDMQAGPGDWIIKGIEGEFYPCKPDIFKATYEAVEDE